MVKTCNGDRLYECGEIEANATSFFNNATWSKCEEIEGYLLQCWKENLEKPSPLI